MTDAGWVATAPPKNQACSLRRCKEQAVVYVELLTATGVIQVGLCLGHLERWRKSEFANRAAFQMTTWKRMVEAELTKDAEEAKAASTVKPKEEAK